MGEKKCTVETCSCCGATNSVFCSEACFRMKRQSTPKVGDEWVSKAGIFYQVKTITQNGAAYDREGICLWGPKGPASTGFTFSRRATPASIDSEEQPQLPESALVAEIRRDLTKVSLRFKYTDNEGKQSDRTVTPLVLTQSTGGWGILAWCHTRDAVRMFLLSRVRAIDPIPRIREFSPEEILAFSRSLPDATWKAIQRGKKVDA